MPVVMTAQKSLQRQHLVVSMTNTDNQIIAGQKHQIIECIKELQRGIHLEDQASNLGSNSEKALQKHHLTNLLPSLTTASK